MSWHRVFGEGRPDSRGLSSINAIAGPCGFELILVTPIADCRAPVPHAALVFDAAAGAAERKGDHSDIDDKRSLTVRRSRSDKRARGC